MSDEPQTGMTKFWSVFAHYKRLFLAVGTASFLPFVAEFADASPPIPGIAPITSLLLILTAVIHLEELKGDRAGQHSVRINGQWRICFVWTPSGPADVEIVDYH